MPIRIKQVDAFTTHPFGGNPAGVVTDAAGLSPQLMQNIAREMNLSETAFVTSSPVADFRVRFFTPRAEVDLCGHATIGTFAALWDEGKLDRSRTVFHQETKAGVLPVAVSETDGRAVFTLTQATPRFEPLPISNGEVAAMLGLTEDDLLAPPAEKVTTGLWWLIFGVKELEILRQAKPDLRLIEQMSREYGFCGISPFCLGAIDPRYDYHLRSIAPFLGVTEDPVCGTGNGCVASYLVRHHLLGEGNRFHWIGEQGQEVDRPGCAYVTVQKSGEAITAVSVGGTAVTVLEGTINC